MIILGIPTTQIAGEASPAQSQLVRCGKHFPTAGVVPLTVLQAQFSLQLLPREIPMFRGAIAEFAGFEEECFHNHDGAREGYHYGYPLIQYHVHRGRAAITAVGEGAAAMDGLLRRYDGRLWMGQRWQRAEVERIEQETFPVGLCAAWETYRIHNWVPLSTDNYGRWRDLRREVDRIEMLERILVGNVLSFARGIGWYVEERIAAEILRVSEPKWCKRHGIPALAFDATFRMRAQLPVGIGLGKGVSVGFGRIDN